MGNQDSQINQTKQIKATRWLSLNEYSNKYHISISTLRRRIRIGHISFRLNGGKYFLEDLKPEEMQPIAAEPKKDILVPAENKVESSEKKLGWVLTAKKWEDFIASQQELYRQLELKDQKISSLQSQLMDLQNLVTILEKENKELKLLSTQEQNLEDWLDGTKVL